jgi:hypothetical protein
VLCFDLRNFNSFSPKNMNLLGSAISLTKQGVIMTKPSTRILSSDETTVLRNPSRYAVNEQSKVVTFIEGEPPAVSGRGRRANPVITEIYARIITNRGRWAHINIPITSKKQKVSIVMSLYNRAKKDNLSLSTRSLYNENSKLYDLWVVVYS